MEHGAKAIKEMKRHHQAYTHTHSFFASFFSVSFYSWQIIFLIWFLLALRTFSVSALIRRFVRSCFVLLLYFYKKKGRGVGDVSFYQSFAFFISCGKPMPWYLSFTTCFSTSISNVFMSFRFFRSSFSLFFHFAFCSNSSLFQVFHSGLMCHVFSTYLLIDTHTHIHTQFHVLFHVFCFVFFLSLWVCSIVHANIEHISWKSNLNTCIGRDSPSKCFASAFPFVHLHRRRKYAMRAKEEKVIIWTVLTSANRHDVLRVRSNSISFARYTLFLRWFKICFRESKRFGRTCVRNEKTKLFDTHNTVAWCKYLPALRVHLGFDYLP